MKKYVRKTLELCAQFYSNSHERLSTENAIISVINYDSEGFSTSKSFILSAQNALGKQHNICYVISKGQKFKSGTFKDHIFSD
jgi:hypothetical protein